MNTVLHLTWTWINSTVVTLLLFCSLNEQEVMIRKGAAVANLIDIRAFAWIESRDLGRMLPQHQPVPFYGWPNQVLNTKECNWWYTNHETPFRYQNRLLSCLCTVALKLQEFTYTNSADEKPRNPMDTGDSYPGYKAAEAWSDHSPPSSVEVKNVWHYTSTAPRHSLRGA